MSMPISTSAATLNGWQGRLELEYAVRQGNTHLIRSQVQAPLKVQRSFYPEGTVCHSVILHTAGGVVGGDCLSLEIGLHPTAHALITTAAAAKIYRSSGAQAHQTTQIQVGEAACLEWLPQETIVFNQANYRQDLRVDLAADALWIGWEITRLGRSARGEKFDRGEWRSHTQVWQQGRPVWIDRQRLQGGGEMMSSPHGLAGCSVVGSLAVVGRSIAPEWVEKARSLWLPLESHDRFAEVGVTRLMAGLLCRYRGHSTMEARRWLTAVWHLLRLELCDRPACKPRVWQL